ncbi:hypothetical protein HDU91_002024 [Kappamyces sp. JEL0680]|nr:hypothetical protein HDU91_002024 [Kappamyces sp. JEL0680]
MLKKESLLFDYESCQPEAFSGDDGGRWDFAFDQVDCQGMDGFEFLPDSGKAGQPTKPQPPCEFVVPLQGFVCTDLPADSVPLARSVPLHFRQICLGLGDLHRESSAVYWMSVQPCTIQGLKIARRDVLESSLKSSSKNALVALTISGRKSIQLELSDAKAAQDTEASALPDKAVSRRDQYQQEKQRARDHYDAAVAAAKKIYDETLLALERTYLADTSGALAHQSLCELCCDNQIALTIVPCRHTICGSCSQRIGQSCPWDRIDVQEFVRVDNDNK